MHRVPFSLMKLIPCVVEEAQNLNMRPREGLNLNYLFKWMVWPLSRRNQEKWLWFWQLPIFLGTSMKRYVGVWKKEFTSPSLLKRAEKHW